MTSYTPIVVAHPFISFIIGMLVCWIWTGFKEDEPDRLHGVFTRLVILNNWFWFLVEIGIIIFYICNASSFLMGLLCCVVWWFVLAIVNHYTILMLIGLYMMLSNNEGEA